MILPSWQRQKRNERYVKKLQALFREDGISAKCTEVEDFQEERLGKRLFVEMGRGNTRNRKGLKISTYVAKE